MMLFKLSPNERPKLVWFTCLAFLVQAGMALGLSATDALFLSTLGPDKLPVVYLLLPVAMVIYTPLASYLQTRFRIDVVMRGALAVLMGGAWLIGFALQGGGAAGFEYGILLVKLFTAIWFIGIYTFFWNFVDSYFTLWEGKRLYGLINAGASLGIILAGLFLAKFSAALSLAAIFYLWGGICLLAIGVAIKISRSLIKLEYDEPQEEAGLGAVLRDTAGAMKRSRYALFTALLYFALPLLSTFNEYICFSVLSEQGDEQAIVALFGKLYGFANVFNLLISLFAFNFLVARFGVRNIVLIQPVAYFLAFFWYFADLSLAAAFFGFFAYHTLLTSVDNNNANFLFNALPARSKKQLRTVIEGLGEPFAIAVSGLILLLFIDDIEPGSLASYGIGGALLVFLIAYVLNQLYVAGLQENLRLGWLDLSTASQTKSLEASPAMQEELRRRMGSSSEAEALVAIRLLSKISPLKAAKKLCEKLPGLRAEQPNETDLLLRTFKTHRNAEVRALVHKALFLDSPSTGKITYGTSPEQTPAAWLSRLQSASTRPEALTQLAHEEAPVHPLVAQQLVTLFAEATEAEIAAILSILERNPDYQSVQHLATARQDLTPEEKRQITALIISAGPRCVPGLLSIIQDEGRAYAMRSLALNALAKLVPAQIELIWLDLVEAELLRAHRHREIAHSLPQTSNMPGISVLRQAHADYERRSLEWILELVSMSGRIPNTSLVLAALNSADQKESSNSVETIIEGAGMRFFRKIQPLMRDYLVTQTPASQAEDFSLSPAQNQIVQQDLLSSHPLLAEAAAYACAREEGGLTKALLWDAVKAPLKPVSAEILRPYVADGGIETQLSSIEQLILLQQTPWFCRLKTHELRGLLASFTHMHLQTGDALPSDGLCLPFADSTIREPVTERETLLKRAHLHGSESLWRDTDHPAVHTVAHEGDWLFLSRAAFRRAVRVFPNFGMHLLALQEEAT